MSAHYKEIKNGRGTNLTINEGSYISVGKDGNDVMVRGAGMVMAFENWDEFVDALDVTRAIYVRSDKEVMQG